MNNVPPSAAWGLMFSLAPLLVADLITMLLGVIGSRSPWGTKNSDPVVNTWRSLPDLRAVIELTWSVAKVTFNASSSNPSDALKLKKSFTLDPNKVDGRDADPPKYNLPS